MVGARVQLYQRDRTRGAPQNVDNVVNVVNVQSVVSSSGNQDILANTSKHTRASAARAGRTIGWNSLWFYSVLYFVLGTEYLIIFCSYLFLASIDKALIGKRFATDDSQTSHNKLINCNRKILTPSSWLDSSWSKKNRFPSCWCQNFLSQ